MRKSASVRKKFGEVDERSATTCLRSNSTRMDSPTDTPRPPLSHQMSSAGNSPGGSPLPSRATSPAAVPQHPFFDYRAERAHLTDKGAFQSELPTALHPPVTSSTAPPIAQVGASLDRLTLHNLSLSNSTTPSATDATSPSDRTRTRSESMTSSRAKGDLTSPRIANLGLSPDSNSRRPRADSKDNIGTTGYVDHGPPNLNPELEEAEEIDEGFTAREFFYVSANVDHSDTLIRPVAENPHEAITAELRALYSSFQRCLDLRDKYMALSRQRLEDNPANYDGRFDPSTSPSYASTSKINPSKLPDGFKQWDIYPPPPAPHWKELQDAEHDPFAIDSTDTTEQIAEKEAMRRKFDWEKALAKVPGKEGVGKRKRFALDSNGVYQVYSDGEFAPIRWSNNLNDWFIFEND